MTDKKSQKKIIRLAVYARVSTDDQTVENQIQILHDVALQKGWIAPGGYICVYSDAGISGRLARKKRPAYDLLLKDVAAKRVSMVACWSIDRAGRSLSELLSFLAELEKRKCSLYLHQQQVDTSAAAGRAFLHMAMVFAEFESSMIGDRVRAGMKRARAEGKVCSQYPPLPADKQERIRAFLADRMTVRKIAKEIGCGHSPIQRIKREMEHA